MKITKFLTAVVLVVALLVTAVSAVYKPSAERDDMSIRPVPQTNDDGEEYIGYISDADGNPIAFIAPDGSVTVPGNDAPSYILITYDQEEGAVSGAPGEMAELPADVIANIADLASGTDSWKASIPGVKAAWEAKTGAPIDNAKVAEVFYAIWVNPPVLPEGCKVTFFVTCDNVSADDKIAVLHYDTYIGEWRFEESELDDKAVIKVTSDRVSPFAIIKDSAEAPAPTDDEPTSPQTGVVDIVPVVTACAVLFAALAAAFVLKARRAED